MKEIKRDLAPYWSFADYLSKQRMQQKEGFASSKPFSKNYELVGILGEITYQLLTGSAFDSELKINGDDGIDFDGGVQLKTSEEFKAKHLIEYKDKKTPPYYVFAIVNVEKKIGYLKGWIGGEEWDKKKRVINFGYGDRYAIDLSELNPYYTWEPFLKNQRKLYKEMKIVEKLVNGA